MSKRSHESVRAGGAGAPRGIGPIPILLSLGLLLLPSAPAWAGAPTDQLKASVDQVIRILGDPALKSESRTHERRAAIRREADTIFDWEETAKRALGPHWRSLSDKDRQEFVSLFVDLLERSYISNIERYSGEKITYAGDSLDGDVATVKTRFTTKDGTEIPMDYRMLKRGDRWLVYDVKIEGVSLVGNYRTQFDKIIHTASYQELVRRLKNRQAEPTAPGGSKERQDTPRP